MGKQGRDVLNEGKLLLFLRPAGKEERHQSLYPRFPPVPAYLLRN